MKGVTALLQRVDFTELLSLHRLEGAAKAVKSVQHDTDATPGNIGTKKRSGETWLWSHLSDHRLLPYRQTEFRMHCSVLYYHTWEPPENVPEESISRYCAEHRPVSPRVGTPMNGDGW